MFGWRARIGYLCPSVFEMIAYDFYRIVPPGVGLIGVTCMIEGWNNDAYRKGLERIEACANELARRIAILSSMPGCRWLSVGASVARVRL